MDKLKMLTANKANQNYQRLAAMFPNAVTETIDENGQTVRAIDKDVLMQEIECKVVEGREERYQFTWPDKRKSVLLANAPTNKTLRPYRDQSVDFDTTQNLYIEGDNLEALKLLQETYLGKVKMIYIDPPYNTGNDFVYNDRFAQTTSEYLAHSGQTDDDGNRLVANTESNGRFHTDWLNMIYPRLRLARDLMSDDGVIFISIDDNEQENLKKICDEIWGGGNFVAQIIWEQGRKSMAAQVAINHEYCLLYCKNKAVNIAFDNISKNTNWRVFKKGLDKIYAEVERLAVLYNKDIEKIENGITAFYKSLADSDPAKAHQHYNKYDPSLGLYYRGDIAQGTGKGGKFPIYHPSTGLPVKCPAGGWRFSESKLPELLKNKRIAFGKDETTIPCIKRYLKETEYEIFASVFYKDGRGASKRLDSLLNKHMFDYPKDEEVIKRFISLQTSYDSSDSLILDFFSGSATTAHAVMQLNAEDGGNRRYIMVQLPEATDPKSEAHKAGYANICEIGKERIRRAGRKITDDLAAKAAAWQGELTRLRAKLAQLKADNPLMPDTERQAKLESEIENVQAEARSLQKRLETLDTGFRVLKCDTSNMKEVFYRPDEVDQTLLENQDNNVEDGRTNEDLLFQVMLELGILLSARIVPETIAGFTVFNVAGGELMACFDSNITNDVVTAIANRRPNHAVFRDSGMRSDAVLTNFDQIFAAISPNTKRRVL